MLKVETKSSSDSWDYGAARRHDLTDDDIESCESPYLSASRLADACHVGDDILESIMRQGSSDKEVVCPVARTVARVGDAWSLMLMREAFYGATRFEQFQKRVGISPNILVRRLTKLIDEGMLVKRQYSRRPPRDEYVLTERGRDFRPVLLTLMDWGTRHFDDLADTMQLVERKTGRVVRIAVVDADTGQPVTEADHHVISLRPAGHMCDVLEECAVGVPAPAVDTLSQGITRTSSK